MAQWTFVDSDGAGITLGDNNETAWDDGATLVPGQEGFDRSAAEAKARELGEGVCPCYAGTPNWTPPPPPAEPAVEPL